MEIGREVAISYTISEDVAHRARGWVQLAVSPPVSGAKHRSGRAAPTST
jgi:hypothetical protein